MAEIGRQPEMSSRQQLFALKAPKFRQILSLAHLSLPYVHLVRFFCIFLCNPEFNSQFQSLWEAQALSLRSTTTAIIYFMQVNSKFRESLSSSCFRHWEDEFVLVAAPNSVDMALYHATTLP